MVFLLLEYQIMIVHTTISLERLNKKALEMFGKIYSVSLDKLRLG